MSAQIPEANIIVGIYGGWGDKGQEYRPDRCEHPKGGGCMWCCQRCNLDRHLCPGCGTPVDHNETACEDCERDASPTPA